MLTQKQIDDMLNESRESDEGPTQLVRRIEAAAHADERATWRATVEALLPMAEESVTRPGLDPVCIDARGLLKRA